MSIRYRINPKTWPYHKKEFYAKVKCFDLIVTNEYYYLVWDYPTDHITVSKLNKKYEIVNATPNVLQNNDREKTYLCFAQEVVKFLKYGKELTNDELFGKDIKIFLTHEETLVREVAKILVCVNHKVIE